MAAVVNIISRCDLSIDVLHRNQPNKSNVVLYKLLTYFTKEQSYSKEKINIIAMCRYVVLSDSNNSEEVFLEPISLC